MTLALANTWAAKNKAFIMACNPGKTWAQAKKAFLDANITKNANLNIISWPKKGEDTGLAGFKTSNKPVGYDSAELQRGNLGGWVTGDTYIYTYTLQGLHIDIPTVDDKENEAYAKEVFKRAMEAMKTSAIIVYIKAKYKENSTISATYTINNDTLKDSMAFQKKYNFFSNNISINGLEMNMSKELYKNCFIFISLYIYGTTKNQTLIANTAEIDVGLYDSTRDPYDITASDVIELAVDLQNEDTSTKVIVNKDGYTQDIILFDDAKDTYLTPKNDGGSGDDYLNAGAYDQNPAGGSLEGIGFSSRMTQK